MRRIDYLLDAGIAVVLFASFALAGLIVFLAADAFLSGIAGLWRAFA